MNAIAERWTGGCRRELPDRTLVWNLVQPRRILRPAARPSDVQIGKMWRALLCAGDAS